MKHGKLILSAVALFVTAASSLALRASSKFTTNHQLNTKTGSTCNAVSCYTLNTGTVQHACTAGTYYTDGGPFGCTHQWTGNKTINL